MTRDHFGRRQLSQFAEPTLSIFGVVDLAGQLMVALYGRRPVCNYGVTRLPVGIRKSQSLIRQLIAFSRWRSCLKLPAFIY